MPGDVSAPTREERLLTASNLSRVVESLVFNRDSGRFLWFSRAASRPPPAPKEKESLWRWAYLFTLDRWLLNPKPRSVKRLKLSRELERPRAESFLSRGGRPLDRNCRRTLLTQLTDRF